MNPDSSNPLTLDVMSTAAVPVKEATTKAPRPRRVRPSQTRRSVIIADRIADWTIRIGGIVVIAAVFGIMAFLIEVVIPLFTGGDVLAVTEHRIPGIKGRVMIEKLDEQKSLFASLTDRAELAVVHVPTGTPLAIRALDFSGKIPTASARTLTGDDIALGFEDGTLRFGRFKLETRVIPPSEMPANLTRLNDNDQTDGAALYTSLADRQVRNTSVLFELADPVPIGEGKAIVAVDYRLGGATERPTKTFVTMDAAAVIRISRSEGRKNLLTGATTETTETTTLPEIPDGLKVRSLLITDSADQVYVASEEGIVYRFDTRDFTKPVLAETVRILPAGTKLGVFGFLIGEQSLVAGGSDGTVGVYNRLQRPGANSVDGYTLVRTHQLEPQPAAVIAMAPSQRGKSFVTGDATGQVWVRHATSEQTALKLPQTRDRPVPESLAFAPREDGVLGVSDDGRYVAWNMAVPHPETTLQSIFGKVWYEGYSEPSFTWQSSSGTDSFEPKLSLVPLIFGTVKAALYSLLFALPIALLAAIFTSEFLHHRARAVIKPAMEMMASLPSVVLGFIAALILAPIVETWIAAVILAFLAIPIGLMLGAYLWQLVPSPIALRFGGLPKFALMFVSIGIAMYAAILLSGPFERLVFDGDFKAWANGDIGNDALFMTVLLLPLGIFLVSQQSRLPFGRSYKAWLRRLPRAQAGLLSMARWVVVLIVSIVASYVISQLLISIGLGARDGVVDTYVQRNALVVGFAMGFAVIPIIYTIAEDALNSVPEHLRAASLACGATPWQTAISIILPTAMSGVFAAFMIGMGRAVGETMIVVMAAGNTPLMDWNIFNGLRALSANIAVELPEAVKDGTLYRMLFLAALTLFVITFVVNTMAEIIRLRFRRRAAQL